MYTCTHMSTHVHTHGHRYLSTFSLFPATVPVQADGGSHVDSCSGLALRVPAALLRAGPRSVEPRGQRVAPSLSAGPQKLSAIATVSGRSQKGS